MKALRKHGNMAARLRKAIEGYVANPDAYTNTVKTMSGSTGRRLRVGDFRMIFEETETEVVVTRIGPRGEVYGR